MSLGNAWISSIIGIPLLRGVVLAAAVFSQVAPSQPRDDTKATHPFLVLSGYLSVSRESKVYDYTFLSNASNVQNTNCINAVIPNMALRNFIKLHSQSFFIIHGELIDFIAEVSKDPIAYTISPNQNSCGNQFVVVIRTAKIANARRSSQHAHSRHKNASVP